MTPTRFSEILTALHWGPQAFAAETGVNERTVRRWLSGQNAIPERFEAWLERLAAFHASNPFNVPNGC